MLFVCKTGSTFRPSVFGLKVNIVYVWRHSQCHCGIFYRQLMKWETANASQVPIRQNPLTNRNIWLWFHIFPHQMTLLKLRNLTVWLRELKSDSQLDKFIFIHLTLSWFHNFWQTYLTSGLHASSFLTAQSNTWKEPNVLTMHSAVEARNGVEMTCICLQAYLSLVSLKRRLLLHIWKSFWADVSVQTPSCIQIST